MKKAFLFLLLPIILFSLFGCESEAKKQPQSEAYFTFSDSLGNEVLLKTKPQRVAVLFSSYADVWQTAGGSVDITVGESVERGFAGENAVLVDGGAGKSINMETLIAAKPDFVIATADLSAQTEAAKTLRQAGIATALFRVDTIDDYLSMLEICTKITKNEEVYQKYGVEVKAAADKIIAAAASSQQEKKRILFVRSGSSYSSAKAKTAADNFVCRMLKDLNTYNIAENAPLLLDGLSAEEIVSENPGYIFISTMGDEAAARVYMDGVLAEPAWQSLDAVKSGSYAYLPKELFQFKPCAKWAEAYAYLSKMLYGE